jgi:hypothetical protein
MLRRCGSCGAKLANSFVDRREDAARVLEKNAAARKERHASRRSLEEGSAELVFERADRSTERRLAHVEAHRGATDVTFFGDGDEIADLLEAHAPIVRDRNGIGSRRMIDRTMHT